MSDTRYRFILSNVRYLREVVGEEKIDNFKRVRDGGAVVNVPANVRADFHYIDTALKTMYCYGDVKWWEPTANKYVMAYYQVHEPVLLVDFVRFKLALSSLLGRGPEDLVQDYEIFSERERLQTEAENAFEVYMEHIAHDLPAKDY